MSVIIQGLKLPAYQKDYKKAVYWVAAAVLNACVTF